MRRIGLLLALACALASCSGGSSGGSTKAAPASTPTQTGSAFPTEAATTAARAALLTVNDFPSGWATSEATPKDVKSQTLLATCLHIPVELVTGDGPGIVVEQSPDFNSPDGDSSVSDAVLVSSGENLDTLFAGLRSPNFPDCARQDVDQGFKDDPSALDGATLGRLDVGQISFPSIGDDLEAIRVHVPVSKDGASVDVYLDLVFVRSGNAVADLEFDSEFDTFPTSDEQRTARLAVQRIQSVSFPSIG
jgi:hypothetical protein